MFNTYPTPPEATNTQLLVDISEMARRLSVSQRQLGYWVSEGRVPALKLGRRCLRFKPQAVLEALEQGGLKG